jgi:hypothetical protein
MSDHTLAFVPVDSWAYSSPELISRNRSVDIGLFAEALIYYQHVLVSAGSKHQFADLISLLVQQGLSYSKLIGLIREDTLRVYDYAFLTNPFMGAGLSMDLYNILTLAMDKPNSFGERVLESEELRRCFPSSHELNEFCKALDGKVIEVKACDFGTAVEEAKRDFTDPRRCTLLMQALVDEMCRLKSSGSPPEIRAFVRQLANGNHEVTYNIGFNELARLMGVKMFVHSMPLSGAAIANRAIESAARLNCDLYLPRPLSVVVGDKLYEAGKATVKTKDLVTRFKASVEFPDIRRLVNNGDLGFNDVLKVRRKAKPFRGWLQAEADRDRDAMIAYHQEVARESGLVRTGRKSLQIFGWIGAPALGAALGTEIGGPLGAAVGAGLGGGANYVLDLASRFGAGWRPVVFGNWFKERIAKCLKE